MPVYKNEKNNTWYTAFYYKDWTGKSVKKKKSGFRTKKEAVEWENSFKAVESSDMDMKLADFVTVYFKDKSGELKERTITSKKYMIERHILPHLGKKKMSEVLPADIIGWQNQMQEQGYSPTYLRMVQNQLTALFTHATRIYGLHNNPCVKVRKMGKSDADTLNFWTKAEYDLFIASFREDDWYKVLFEVLFWTGCRIGEVLALSSADINMKERQIYISKTYHRMHKQDIITKPKTENSIRTIDIPQFLVDEIEDYKKKRYDLQTEDRLFPVVAEAVQHKLKRQIEKAGVKKIRVHDFRHSHVAFLIDQKVEPLMIKERCGHSDIKITLNTYGHLYPNRRRELAEKLNSLR